MKKFLIILSLSICSLQVVGQQVSVSGKVVDAKGNVVPGVVLAVDGKQINASTNQDGMYFISVPSAQSTITVLAAGYQLFTTTVGNRTIINITLEEMDLKLDEVVVVGYGTSRRQDLTGSISSVRSDQIEDIPVMSAAQAIAGKMSGVVVTQSEGSLDADIKVRVRGGGSITQDNSPLYIVDGFPVEDINDIAPSEIASIDVLKDASSTAIYGARGANGVVIVTTKSGSVGKAKISFNTYFGVKQMSGCLDVLSPYEYVLWQYEINPGGYVNYFGDFKDAAIYNSFSGINWQKEILGGIGTQYYNNLSVSGGTKDIKYNIYLTRNDIKDIMIDTEMHRTNLGVKTDYVLTRRLKLDLNLRFTNSVLHGAGTSQNSRLSNILQFRPFDSLTILSEEASEEEESSVFLNPLEQTLDDYRRTFTKSHHYNGGFSAKLGKGFDYRLEGGAQYNSNEIRRFYGINTSNAYNYGRQPLASVQNNKSERFRLANILTYSKQNIKSKHNVKVMLGQELNYHKSVKILSSAKYFPQFIDAQSALAMMNLGIADPVATSEPAPEKLSSFFGRLNYDFKRKYLFNATLRADGSSMFASGNRWGYFPSVGIAWRISQEGFMSPARKWLNDLKIRMSYGQSGNNRILSDAWQKTYSVIAGRLYMGSESTPTMIFDASKILENPSLKWETTVTRTLGVDYTLFGSRISGSFEVYYNTTRDLLIQAKVPPNTGYETQWQNIGRTSNRGLEATLTGRIINKSDVKLTAQFNIGFNRNKIEKLGVAGDMLYSSISGSDGPVGDFIIREGGKVGLMYGYVTDGNGMYSFDDFTYNPSTQTYTLKPGVADNSAITKPKYFGPGALKFVNQNPQDGPMVDADNDRVVIGDANPIHTGGFTLNGSWKGLDMSMAFNWSYGNDVYNLNKLLYTNYYGGRLYKSMLGLMNSSNRFINFDPQTGQTVREPEQLAQLNSQATYWSASMTRAPLHSWAIEDGSFLRLNTLTIGYTFPKAWVSRLKIERLRIYFTGYNLWLWTNYTGYDPEVDAVLATPLTPGVDYNAYPRSRTYNIGINITF